MRGSESEPGMMVLCVRDILEWVRSHPDIQYKIRVAYLEVYNEEINDLLGEPGLASKNLKIVSEDALRGAVIGGLVEEDASTSDQFMEILRRGEQSRSYASTNMNAESSRSHTIYRITIEARGGGTNQVEEEDSLMGGGGGGGSSASSGRVSYLNLVDLAGSERQKSTKAEGKVLKEGANINKSLLALGAVIKKLGEVSKIKKGTDKSASFIPFRDSKLTRILKQSLSGNLRGNALTSVLCTVIPTPMHRKETVSTLTFGQLCNPLQQSSTPIPAADVYGACYAPTSIAAFPVMPPSLSPPVQSEPSPPQQLSMAPSPSTAIADPSATSTATTAAAVDVPVGCTAAAVVEDMWQLLHDPTRPL